MRKPAVYVLLSLGVLLATVSCLLLSCSEKDTPMFSDEEKVAAAKALVDHYVEAWNEMNVNRITSFYAGYASILVPSVGSLSPKSYNDYLRQLFSPMAEISYQAEDRDVHLVEAEIADIKFRAWVLMRTNAGEYSANKTWIAWRLHWSADDEWKIATENGSDRVVVKDQFLAVLAAWITAWETKNVDGILSIYTPDATIIESDGQQYDLAGYRDVLNQQFSDITEIDLQYLLFHIDQYTWEQGEASFQLLSTIERPSSEVDFRTDNVSWSLTPSGDNWLVQSQQTENVSVTDDDAVDDDTVDDDTTDDDTADDDTVDDDTVDDDTTDDDSVSA